MAESSRLLEVHWRDWCAARVLDADAFTVVTAPPVVHRVGLESDELTWVALIRFTAVGDGQHLHGLVRGPAEDVVFRIDRPSPNPGVGVPATRGWWARARRSRWLHPRPAGRV